MRDSTPSEGDRGAPRARAGHRVFPLREGLGQPRRERGERSPEVTARSTADDVAGGLTRNTIARLRRHRGVVSYAVPRGRAVRHWLPGGASVRSKATVHVVSQRLTGTNRALLAALGRLGVAAEWTPPRSLRSRMRPSDVVLGRLDVLPSLDGVEHGLEELRQARAAGLTVLNGPDVLLTSHDKLATALACAGARLPHPATAEVDETGLEPPLPLPIVLKPRFGSWGTDVYRCDTVAGYASRLREVSTRPWFVSHGALVQELVEPVGYDLRVIVAGGRVIGAIERHARPGEWRTNVALGATRHEARLTERARELARAAAASVGGDLVGVDLLPVADDFVVLEVNGAVDFTTQYSLGGRDVFYAAAAALAAAIRAVPARAVELGPAAPALEPA